LTCAVRVLKRKPSGLSANSQRVLLRQTESGQLAYGKSLQRFISIAKKHSTQLIYEALCFRRIGALAVAPEEDLPNVVS